MTALEMARAEIDCFEDWRDYADRHATRPPDIEEVNWYCYIAGGPIGPYARTFELMMARWIVEQSEAAS